MKLIFIKSDLNLESSLPSPITSSEQLFFFSAKLLNFLSVLLITGEF